MKKLYTVLLVLLLAVMMLVGFWSLVDIDATESELEKRSLAKFPKFTIARLLDGTFVSELETYYSDTFPGREAMLLANRNLNKFYFFSGGNEENNMLIIDFNADVGHGGEALQPEQQPGQEQSPEQDQTPEQQSPEQQPEQEPPPEEEQVPEEDPDKMPEIQEPTDYSNAGGSIIITGNSAIDIPTAQESIIKDYAGAVNNLHAALGDSVQVTSLVTPNSGHFYSPKDMHTGVHDQQAMISLCYENMDPDVVTVDAFTALAKHADEYIYFRTDHHWTALGAYYAYTAFCKAKGLEAVPLDQFETGVYEGFVGSMYGYTSQYPQSAVLKNNPDTLTYYLPVVDTTARYYADADLANSTAYPVSVVYRGITESESNKYMCFLGGDHPVTVITTDVEGPTCLILKDSYGNAFVPFLTSHYSKIIVVDPREFNHNEKPRLDLTAFAQEQQIDELIVINYPFMINNQYYVTWLNRLVGIDLAQ